MSLRRASDPDRRLDNELRRRYAVALAAIALLSLGAHMFFSRAMERQTAAVTAARLTGLQQSLVQQISVTAHQLTHEAPGNGEAAEARARLRMLVDQLRRQHRSLLTGDPSAGLRPLSDDLRSAYFDAPSQLNTEITSFLAGVDALLDRRPGSVPAGDAAVAALQETAAGRVRLAYERTADAYEAEGDAIQDRVGHVENALTAATLAVLLLELLLVFRPLASRIRRHVNELAQARADLASIIDAAPVAVLTADRDGRILSTNRSAEATFEPADGVLEGRVLSECFVPDPGTDPEVMCARAVAGEPTSVVDLVGRRGAEGRFKAHVSVSSAQGAGGEVAVVVTNDVTEREAFQTELAHQAMHDALTGLPNRVLLLDSIGNALARGRRRGGLLGVLFLDLDRFKLINDSLGHGAGDDLLKEVARRVSGAMRSYDRLSRFGGDEFVILSEDLASERDAVALAERIAAVLEAPFDLDGQVAHVAASIGIATARHGQGDAESLIRDADAAMYRAKESGRARCEVFDEGMRLRVLNRLNTENELRAGLGRGELLVEYQPLVRVADCKVVGAEALARWEHPERGLLGPGEFIEMAEESGLIVPLGAQVFDEACRQVSAWRKATGSGLPHSISVNLSAEQLSDPGLVGMVRSTLERHELSTDAVDLELEITESALARDPEAVSATLAELKSLGLSLALDDFGTGHSSLTYLRQFPIDTLKIDRSFVMGMLDNAEDAAIVRSVVSLGHALNLSVVAEGVEQQGQLDELRALGCDLAQGFLLGRPGAPSGLAGVRRVGAPEPALA